MKTEAATKTKYGWPLILELSAYFLLLALMMGMAMQRRTETVQVKTGPLKASATAGK